MFYRCLRVATVVLAGAAMAVTTVLAQLTGEELTRLAEEGESLFRQQCIACHTLGGGDQPTGPDLAGVTERRDRSWLVAFIRDPGGMIKAGDPVATRLLQQYHNLQMPALPLAPAEMDALLTYLGHPEEAAHHPPAAIAPMVTGDAVRGARYYTGETAFANGSAPCLACHGITGFGLAGGASYGPDLTTLFDNFGDEGLADILQSLPFPSMEPIYASRPLTEQEQADLRAFFAQAGGSPQSGNRLLLIEVLSGALLVFAIVLLAGHTRLRGIRQALVERSRASKEVRG